MPKPSLMSIKVGPEKAIHKIIPNDYHESTEFMNLIFKTGCEALEEYWQTHFRQTQVQIIVDVQSDDQSENPTPRLAFKFIFSFKKDRTGPRYIQVVSRLPYPEGD